MAGHYLVTSHSSDQHHTARTSITQLRNVNAQLGNVNAQLGNINAQLGNVIA